MESHKNTPSQIMEYIRNNPDLQKAIELLREEKKVSCASLQFEFNWTNWKARKVYEALRYVCFKGLAFKEDESHEYVCRANHGHVDLIGVGRGLMDDMVIDEELSQESENKDWEEEEDEEDEEEE